MRLPTIIEAEKLLNEAEQHNPGAWIGHSKTAAFCARAIAKRCDNLDADTAYILGLLHDIGRREGVTDMRHIIDGYNFMTSLGYDDCARICLTHSFPYKDIHSYNGNIEYDDYDRLIQLCDALALPDGATYIEKRLVDVVMRRGFNDLTIPKWKAFFDLKDYFDKKMGTNLYLVISI
nr:HD domain-containing protein [uncultured Ruminococcus sp.]